VPFSTLPGASYTQSFGYDGLTRLSHSGLGAYTYGDSAHLDAVTAAGSNGQGGPFYTARYDAEGNMVCRAAATIRGVSPTTPTSRATPSSAPIPPAMTGSLAGWCKPSPRR